MSKGQIKELRNQYLIAIILSTIMITRYYTGFIPGIMLSELLLIFTSIFVIFIKKPRFTKLQVKIFLLAMFAVLLSFISLIIQRENLDIIVFTRILRVIFTIFIIIFIIKYIHKDILTKVYKHIVYIVIIYLLMQTILWNFNIETPIKILPIDYYSEEYIYNPYSAFLFRPAAFFAEPAHLAQFLMPSLVFSVFGWHKNRMNDIILLLFIGIAIFISASTLGIVSGLIVTIISIYLKYRKQRFIYSIIMLVGLFSLLLVVTNSDNEIIKYTISKIDIFNSQRLNLDGIRVFRGWSIFSQLPFRFKMLGIGHGNLANYVFANNITTQFDPANLSQYDYASGISLLFLYYGIGFASLYLFIIYRLFKLGDNINKMLIITYIILLFAIGSIFGMVEIFYFSFIITRLSYKKETNG